MAITWKSRARFAPELVLARIESVRTVDGEGRVSYSGREIDEYLPTLRSMLQFPPAAAGTDAETLVWRALSKVGKDLTPDTFRSALNLTFEEQLAIREIDYVVLTSMSLDPLGLPTKWKLLDCVIELRSNKYPRKFNSREQLIKEHPIAIADTPENYCKVIAKVRGKSDGAAFHKAMRAIDLLRSILCLMANSRMESTFGYPSFEPINAIGPGGKHTMHSSDGATSRKGLWYEPGFTPKRLFKFEDPANIAKNLRWALRRIEKSKLKEPLIASLLQFVRALDHSDSSTAFLRLWSALEALTTPGVADYDKLIRRSSFLFKEHAYHKQVLEHLRAYRNANVHAGEESENARIHCFQLQRYFVSMAWFYIRNYSGFSNLEEVGQFLDMPPDPVELKRRLTSINQAIRFTSPK